MINKICNLFLYCRTQKIDTFQCLKMKAGMKRSATLTQQGTHSILINSVSELDEASAVNLPKLESLKQTVCRERKRTANVPPEP